MERRHEGHLHTANVKYGYGVFLVSLVNVAVVIAIPRVARAWNRGRGQGSGQLSSRGLARWASPEFRWLPQTLIWVVILAVLGVWHIEWKESYSVAIKRFGRMAFCLLPFDILLAYKYWPLEDYLHNLDLHKWMSRIIIGCSVIHGVGYLIKWLVLGTLFSHVIKVDNLLGVVVFVAAVALVVLSTRFFRRSNYRLFYLTHNVTIGLFVVVIFFHARPPVTLFAAICATMLGVLFLIKLQTYPATPVALIESPGSSLSVVSFPWENLLGFVPGCHVRINYSNRSWQAWLFPSHPYTAVTLPGSQTLDVIAKRGTFKFAKDTRYNLSSPYASINFADPVISTYNSATIVCGGSGISLGIPVFKYLQSKLDVTMVWCTRNKNDLFILRHYNLLNDIQVYITGNLGSGSVSDSAIDSAAPSADDEEGHGLMQAIELQNLDEPAKGPEVRAGRPDWDQLLGGLLASPENGCVITCGPRLLVKQCEQWCRNHSVDAITEIYEM